ncbi:hypothetical protein CK203_099923 [Vitis vinifera]|uniref:Uncharacterized protein n=1 Tax=Vitis vinifera TaxID=29760 RepID=A0A438CES2_VITVI|nr:hypothetical protein CK203_099923 [Vitis vinifera]
MSATFGALSGVQFMHAICRFEAQEVNNPMLQTDERLGFSSLGVRKAGQVISVHGDALVYLLRAFGRWFEGKSKVKDHLEWQVLGERYEPLQGASEKKQVTGTPFLYEESEPSDLKLQETLFFVITFVDYSLNQGAPAGHKSAETPSGHESMIPQSFVVVLFVTNLYVAKEMEEEMFCYIHEGDELVKTVVGSVEYKGGQTNCIVVSKNISHSEFISKVCDELNLEPNSIKLDFTVKFDPSCLLPLHNDVDIVKMFEFNDMFCRAYVFQCTKGGDGFICPTSAPTPIVASNSTHVSSIGEPPLHMSNESPTIESFGFS